MADESYGESIKKSFHRKAVSKGNIKVFDANFEEGKHPRDESGKFSSGGGSGKTGGKSLHKTANFHIEQMGEKDVYNKNDPREKPGQYKYRIIHSKTGKAVGATNSDLSDAKGMASSMEEFGVPGADLPGVKKYNPHEVQHILNARKKQKEEEEKKKSQESFEVYRKTKGKQV